MKKFELALETEKTFFGVKMFRVRALISFPSVSAGDIGGYIENDSNLSNDGNAWVYGNAQVYGGALVSGNAQVSGNARVYGNAQVYGDAQVYGGARVYGGALVSGDARVYGDAAKSPINLIGLKYTVTIADNQVVWGCRTFTFDEVKALELKDCQESWDESEFKLNKKIITECIRYYRRES